MKFIKLSLLILLVGSLSSCLKAKNDFAGLRTDSGNIVISITEKQYLNADLSNIGFGFQAFANFSFSTPNEAVRFFTLHVSQPRDKKMSGPITVHVVMTNVGGYDPVPANAVSVVDVVIPQSSAMAFDVPVTYSVNKALLNTANWYGATFTITSVSEGVFSDLDKSLEVIFNDDPFFNTSKYTGRYKWKSTVSDPAGQFLAINNTKPVNLEENAANNLDPFDFEAFVLSGNAAYRYLWANNTSNGANTAIFRPRYVLDATGKVTSITNQSNVAASSSATTVVLVNTAVTNIVVDPSTTNQFTYTSNGVRTMTVKYSFDLTTTINSVVTTRKVTVTESWTYDAVQAFY
ncbi:MAG TPA: hypothetical protein VLJ68_08385 [Chitinophagaceae bacterium]|nr:hypothetical protein [Chitinophagaceae bacterium]